MATLMPLFVPYWSVVTGGTAVGSASATTITITTGDGAKLPTIGTNQYVPALISDTSASPEVPKEFVWVTAVSGDTLTVTRQAESASLYPASTTSVQTGYTISFCASAAALAALLALSVGPATANLSLNGTGRYTVPGWKVATGAPVANGALGASTRIWFPIFVSPAQTFDRLSVHVATAATTGATMRLGIYDDAGTITPTGATSVLVDSTVAIDTTGLKELTISQTLSGWKWLTYNPTAAVTVKALASTLLPPFSLRLDAPNAAENVMGLGKSIAATTALAANPVPDFEIATNTAGAVCAYLRMA